MTLATFAPAIPRAPAQAPFIQRFCFLCGLLVMVGLVTSISEVMAFLSGVIPPGWQALGAFRWLREGIYAVMLFDFVLYSMTITRRPMINRLTLLLACITASLLAICALRAVTLELPLTVIASGLRFLEYVPLALIAATVYGEAGDAPFKTIARWVLLFITAETVLALIELRLPPLFGRTFIGSRPFGTFVHPNIFGATAAFCYIFLRAGLSKRWQLPVFAMCLFDVVASGARAGMLGMLAVIVADAFFRIPNPWTRLLAVFSGIVLSPVALILGSSAALTGRDTGIGHAGGFERFGVWPRIIANLQTVGDYLIGWGMGLGSNTVFSFFGGTIKGVYVSDNTFLFLLGSYGLIGILLVLLVLAVLLFKLRHDPIGIALFAILLLQLLVVQAMEVYPENVLAMLFLGWRLAVSGAQEKRLAAAVMRVGASAR